MTMAGVAARARAAAAAPTDAVSVQIANGLKAIGAWSHCKRLALASCGRANVAADEARKVVLQLGKDADAFLAGTGKRLAWSASLKLMAFKIILLASRHSLTLMDCIGSQYGQSAAALGSLEYFMQVDLSCDANTDIIADALVASPFGQRLYLLVSTTTIDALRLMTPDTPTIVALRTLLQQSLPKLEDKFFSIDQTTKRAQRQRSAINDPTTSYVGKPVAASLESLIAAAAAEGASSGGTLDGGAEDGAATMLDSSSSSGSSSGSSGSGFSSSSMRIATSQGSGSAVERRRVKSSAAAGLSHGSGSSVSGQAAAAGSSGAGGAVSPITGVKRARRKAALVAYEDDDEDDASVRTAKRSPPSGGVIELSDSESE